MRHKDYVIFDIETGPLSSDELTPLMPEFEPDARCTKPDSREASILKKQEAWKSRAALSALTGRVLCVGWLNGVDKAARVIGTAVEGSDDEVEVALLKQFWEVVGSSTITPFIGFNSNGFDLPFLWRRSRILGVEMPAGLRRGRYWCDRMIDLMEEWQLGNRTEFVSLDVLGRTFGCPPKLGSGADFAGLWNLDRGKAIAYAKRDVEITYDLAVKMGVCQ